jgi:peptidoglycan/LPS O-acetylase OafA/YrhL
MPPLADAKSSHQNNFGLLRLIFAFLVIVSHSFELIDGNRSREPLTRLFGTLSFGELGVDGFFILSGYLIVQSFDRSPAVATYLLKRVLRIYPAFIVAYIVCLFIVAPLSGADMLALRGWGGVKAFLHLVKLDQPWLPNVFPGQPYPALDGSMWTIPYEFRCYLAVIPLGLAGLFRRPIAFVSVIGAAMLVAFLAHGVKVPSSVSHIVGDVPTATRLTGMFFTGSVLYVCRKYISYRRTFALVSLILLCGLMFNHALAEFAVAIFGGYLLF